MRNEYKAGQLIYDEEYDEYIELDEEMAQMMNEFFNITEDIDEFPELKNQYNSKNIS